MTLGKSLCNLSAPQFPPLPISVCMELEAFFKSVGLHKDDYCFYFSLSCKKTTIAHSLKLNPGTFYWSWRSEGSLNFCTETRGKMSSRGMNRSFSSKFSKGAMTQKSLEYFLPPGGN